ncbi:hypothetical protein C2E23DRAFT_733276 [Lenzites betulinus]|nr:hypothetical protein C2E23DRAFT_733276 [Lenzites betulinus]
MNSTGTYSGSSAILDQILWQDTQRVFDALAQAEGAARSSAAALAMLTWDILTSLDEEVRLRFMTAVSEWSLPKSLYLFVRYYSLVSLTIQNVQVVVPCIPWLIFQFISTFLVEAAVQIIIILRVYAVYATQPKVMRFMLSGFAIEVVLMAVSLGLSINKVRAGWDCKAADLPTEMVIYSTASIVYESFLFVLMMYKILGGAKDGFSDTTLLNSLVRDGAVAFISVYTIMLTNTILFTMAPSTLVTLGFPWLLATLGTAGPRLILNLRAQHEQNIGSLSSSFDDPHFRIPSHFYSALSLDDVESAVPLRSMPRSRSRPVTFQMGSAAGGSRAGMSRHAHAKDPDESDEESDEEDERVALNARARAGSRDSGMEAGMLRPSGRFSSSSGSDDDDAHTLSPPISPPVVVPR